MNARARLLPARIWASLLGAALIAVAVAGPACGGDSDQSVAGGAGQPAPGGILSIALTETPRTLDPLLARTRADLLVVRQINQPLIENLTGPYGDVRRLPGLALAAHPLADKTIWRLRLRQNVRFQDGARFNASAVLENARRWRTTIEGAALLPGLVAVDAPRPDLVRFIFDRPVPGLSRQLSSPRLSVVSPRILRSPQAEARLARGDRTGTGAFELRERSSSRVLIARYVGWWGTKHDLGPAVDQVELRAVDGAHQRLTLLRRGEVQVAERLGPAELAGLRRDPLLTEQQGPDGTALGLERSIRGIAPGEIPVLSGVWLTRVGSATG
jgi:peptide/nickel transport system substrate-binding protein